MIARRQNYLQKNRSDDMKASSCAQITELVKEVTESPLHEKVLSLVDSLILYFLWTPSKGNKLQ